MTAVTVLGASGTIAVPFKSSVNASFAQQLANQITSAVSSGALTPLPYNPSSTGPLPTGTAENELVIGGIGSTGGAASGGTSYAVPDSYVAIVNNADQAVTIQAGSAPVAPMSVLAGTGGTTFFSGPSSIGGSIFVGGGANTIAGSSAANGALTSLNGGLSGNWLIGSGSGSPGLSDDIYLASGVDTVALGGGDTVHAGGAAVLGLVTNTDTLDPTFFIGSSPSTVFGLAAADVNILGNDGATGGGVYVLGTGGDGVIAAGAGNTTLVGGGNDDTLYASTATGAQAMMFAGAGNETLQGGYSGGTSTLYGGSGTDVLAGGAGSDVVAAGSGADTIFTGLGQDSVWFYAPTATSVKDTITDFDPNNDTLILQGYPSYAVTSAAGAPLTITLSDSSTITFMNLTTSQAGSLKITTIT